ncbi:carbon storage regulator CsrA [Paenibacillus sp. y28]|uniref:carbon storage regulator CsrA n=1 Tax=Paenibacillus sp. y28 TaxID=3129110 RepID=UPI003018AF26
MLILTRKKGQSIMINDNIEIVISAIDGDQVKIGIEAPSEINILRKEVYLNIQESNKEAAQTKMTLNDLKKLIKPE